MRFGGEDEKSAETGDCASMVVVKVEVRCKVTCQNSLFIMKLTDKIAARDSSSPFYFFEFFPPRTEQVPVLLSLVL